MSKSLLTSSPHSMSTIMESWRGYMEEAQVEYDKLDLDVDNVKIYLFENKSPSPTGERLLSEVIADYESDAINEDQLFAHLNETYDYEHRALVEEGVLDVLKAPIQKFANTKAAIAAKAKARSATAAFAAKLFGRAMKVIKAITGKARGLEGQLLSVMKDETSGEMTGEKLQAAGNAAMKLHQAATKMITQAAKGLAALAKKILMGVIKVFTHPLVRAAVVVICAGILLLAVINSSIFVGSLAAAPAFAIRRLGREGARKFWNMIPNQPVAANEGQAPSSLKLLSEDVEIGNIIAQAMADIAAAIPEGADDIQDYVAISDLSQAVDASGEVTTQADNFLWIQEADGELSDNLQAVQELAGALNSAMMEGQMEELLSATQMVDDRVGRIIQTALKTAELTCENDPAMCAASRVLAEEFKTFNVDVGQVSTESVDYMKRTFDAANDIDFTEAERTLTQTSTGTSTARVTRNPFADDRPDPNDPGARFRDPVARTTTLRR